MDICYICKLQKTYKAIASFEIRVHKSVGLNFNEMTLLCILSDLETRLAGEIADKLDLTRSNASKVISSLEKKSYIRRSICKEDSRCQRFHITKKGIEVLQVICNDIEIPNEVKTCMSM